MNRTVPALAVTLTLATTAALGLTSGSSFAAPPKPATVATPPADAPVVASVSAAVARIKCGKTTVCGVGTGPGAVFEGFRWGIRHEEVSTLYNKPGGVFDVEYNRRLVKMQPGPEMTALEAERDDRKRAFDASFIQFGGTPTGYDATPIKNEYTYRNKESIQSVDLGGARRYFFYIGSPPGERLWKVYDEVRLNDESTLGKSFQDAVTAVNTFLGVAGRVRAADPSQNIYATTVDWQDEKSRLRLIDRAREKMVGVVLEDRATVSALPQLRGNKAEDPFALDPSIQAVTAGGHSDPNAVRDAGAAPKPGRKP